nr:MAG TPA: hypothetical protein [Caudoviricetes sp.]
MRCTATHKNTEHQNFIRYTAPKIKNKENHL